MNYDIMATESVPFFRASVNYFSPGKSFQQIKSVSCYDLEEVCDLSAYKYLHIYSNAMRSHIEELKSKITVVNNIRIKDSHDLYECRNKFNDFYSKVNLLAENDGNNATANRRSDSDYYDALYKNNPYTKRLKLYHQINPKGNPLSATFYEVVGFCKKAVRSCYILLINKWNNEFS